jgi:tRNA A-37 threonylcarbamoyl transferase component Bud32
MQSLLMKFGHEEVIVDQISQLLCSWFDSGLLTKCEAISVPQIYMNHMTTISLLPRNPVSLTLTLLQYHWTRKNTSIATRGYVPSVIQSLTKLLSKTLTSNATSNNHNDESTLPQDDLLRCKDLLNELMKSCEDMTVHGNTSMNLSEWLSDLQNMQSMLLSTPRVEQVNAKQKEITDKTESISLTPPYQSNLSQFSLTASQIIPATELSVNTVLDVNVYKGQWRRHTLVAIKINRSKKSIADFAIETEIQRLYTLRHPRIVSVLGLCTDLTIENEIFSASVLEFMEKGNLRTVLNTEHAIMSWASKLTIAVDICEGMRYLHESHQIVHGALSSENVLIDGHGRAKLTGFGASNSNIDLNTPHIGSSTPISITPSSNTSTANNGKKSGKSAKNGKQTSPSTSSSSPNATSQLSPLQKEQKEDIFCFGAMLWELVTGKKLPWSSDHKQQANRKASKLILSKEEIRDCLPAISSMMKHCLEGQPTERPMFIDLFETLYQLNLHERQRWKDQQTVIPDGFICPITQDIMKDPVMLLDGHSYERTAIEDWLKRSARSPLTNELLKDPSILLDNYALKSSIESFLKSHPGLSKK